MATQLWVGFNVGRIIIAYFLPAAQTTAAVRETFRYTLGGTEAVGYKKDAPASREAFAQRGLPRLPCPATKA